MLTRREFGHALRASVPVASAAWAQANRRVPRYASRFADVRIGAQTYCYRSLRDTSLPWSAARVDQLMDHVVTRWRRIRSIWPSSGSP
jgi:hypothetical protein